MPPINPTTTLVHPVPIVKSINSQLPLFSLSPVIHHKEQGPRIVGYSLNNIVGKGRRYGVSSSRRVLAPQLLLKKWEQIRNCLEYNVGLTTAQREATLRLLRYWAYYGHVYVKESQVTLEPGCSKATYWRTVMHLKDLGLLRTIPRYLIRPHAQISNLYLLDRLVLLLARYLAEHGQAFREKWLEPYLVMPGRLFWGSRFAFARSDSGGLPQEIT